LTDIIEKGIEAFITAVNTFLHAKFEFDRGVILNERNSMDKKPHD